MYFAQSIEEHRIEVFKILLFRTLDGYDGYRDEISKVVVDAIDLLRGKKSLSNRDYYNLLSVFESNLDFCMA